MALVCCPSCLAKRSKPTIVFCIGNSLSAVFSRLPVGGNWKVVRPKKEADLELYNLAKDIGEKKDVANLNPEIVSIFERFLKTARTESKDWPLK